MATLQELDQQQREFAERRRIANQDGGPSFDQIVIAVLQAVDIDTKDKLANSPEELVSQARSLLEAKGKLTKPPHGSISVVRPDEHDYLRLPFPKVETGGRTVDINLEEAVHGVVDRYYFGVGLRVGDDTIHMTQALTITNNGVSFTAGHEALDIPDHLQRISKILTMTDKAILLVGQSQAQ